jgi:putative ABC transport system substrate-binding protein
MQFDQLKRREFITLLGGTAATWPLAGHAQQPAMPVIGFLSGTPSAPFAHLVAAYRQGLREMGYVEGRNLVIEFRWAEGQYDRLPEMAADLVRRQVAVITTTGGDPAALAAKAATATIPVVFTAGTDPVKSGLVASLSRPGGNATGVFILTAVMEGKRLGLLQELVPTVTRIAVLLNPTYTAPEAQLKEVEEAARTLGLQTQVLHASTELDLDTAFAVLTRSSIVSAITLSRWRRTMQFQLFMNSASLRWSVGWRATARASQTPITRSASIPGVYSTAINPPTYR